MIRRPPRSTHCISSAASDVYKRQVVVVGSDFVIPRCRHFRFRFCCYFFAGPSVSFWFVVACSSSPATIPSSLLSLAAASSFLVAGIFDLVLLLLFIFLSARQFHVGLLLFVRGRQRRLGKSCLCSIPIFVFNMAFLLTLLNLFFQLLARIWCRQRQRRPTSVRQLFFHHCSWFLEGRPWQANATTAWQKPLVSERREHDRQPRALATDRQFQRSWRRNHDRSIIQLIQ